MLVIKILQMFLFCAIHVKNVKCFINAMPTLNQNKLSGNNVHVFKLIQIRYICHTFNIVISISGNKCSDHESIRYIHWMSKCSTSDNNIISIVNTHWIQHRSSVKY